jgi:hypothetical protein
MKRNPWLFMSFLSVALATATLAPAGEPVVEPVPADQPAPAAAPASEDSPKIQLDKMVYDFGEVTGVDKVEGKFVITNVGKGILELGDAKPTCGCTVAKVSKSKLASGESAELPFTMKISSGHGGLLEKFIGLPSNDPLNGNIRLTLRVNVKQIFSIEPATAFLGDVQSGTTTNVTITVTRLDGKPIDIKEHKASEGIQAKVEPVADSKGKAVKILVEFKAAGNTRRFNESVTLTTNDSNISQPVANIAISGRVVGEVVANPEMLFWGVSDPANWPGPRGDQITRRAIKVSIGKSEKSLAIKSVKSSIENVSLTVSPVEEGKIYEIQAVLEKAPEKSTKGTLTIETNNESIPTIELPININVFDRRPVVQGSNPRVSPIKPH